MKKSSQQGMTTIGLIIVIAIFGSIVLTGFKILPMYLEYNQVKSILDAVAVDVEIDPKSKSDLWEGIRKRLKINQVDTLKREHVSFNREDGVTIITADYEVRKPYIAQLFLGAHFVYSVSTNR